jgi:hypothetical protein
MRTFTHLWQHDDLSDCDIVLTAQQHNSSSAEDGTCKLVTFPGHIVLLSDSPFFKAQMGYIQHQHNPSCEAHLPAAGSCKLGTQMAPTVGAQTTPKSTRR